MNFSKNTKTRELALQIIYSLIILKKKNWKSKIKEFKLINNNILKNINITYLYKILSGVYKNIKYIKKILIKNINKKTKYIGKIEKTILYIAIYEIKKNKKLSYKIIINESIKLSKKFCSINSYKFINSILDKICFKKK